MTDIEQETLPSAQLTIGWKWFEYHAKQRLDIFKFFLTIYTAVAVGGSVLYDRGFFRLAMVLGGVNFLASWLFWRLDVRSRRLTGYGEDLLDAALEGERIPPRLNPIQRARIGGDGGIRFKTAFGLTYTM